MVSLNRAVFWGAANSSVDSSAPTILLPLVRVPSTSSAMLLSFTVKFVLYICHVKRTENQKEAGLGKFMKKQNSPTQKCIFDYEGLHYHRNLVQSHTQVVGRVVKRVLPVQCQFHSRVETYKTEPQQLIPLQPLASFIKRNGHKSRNIRTLNKKVMPKFGCICKSVIC